MHFILFCIRQANNVITPELKILLSIKHHRTTEALSGEASVSGIDGSIAYRKVKSGFLQNGPAVDRSVCSQTFLFTTTWQNNEGLPDVELEDDLAMEQQLAQPEHPSQQNGNIVKNHVVHTYFQ